jgi:hypothetical protein
MPFGRYVEGGWQKREKLLSSSKKDEMEKRVWGHSEDFCLSLFL